MLESVFSGLLGFFVSTIAKPLARFVLFIILAALGSGIVTLTIVQLAKFFWKYVLYPLLKYGSIVVLFLGTFVLLFMYMNADKDTWDMVLADPSMTWNVTHGYMCSVVRLVTDKQVGSCLPLLLENMTDLQVIRVGY